MTATKGAFIDMRGLAPGQISRRALWLRRRCHTTDIDVDLHPHSCMHLGASACTPQNPIHDELLCLTRRRQEQIGPRRGAIKLNASRTYDAISASFWESTLGTIPPSQFLRNLLVSWRERDEQPTWEPRTFGPKDRHKHRSASALANQTCQQANTAADKVESSV